MVASKHAMNQPSFRSILVWILGASVWNDLGIWIDSATWSDS